jgi:hypothetical protein
MVLRSNHHGAHPATLHSCFTTDALLLLLPKMLATFIYAIIMVPKILNEMTGSITRRIVQSIALLVIIASGSISPFIATLSFMISWVSFHVAVRIKRSQSAQSDDDVWIPPRSFLENGFQMTWRWPFYKELEEREDGYVMIESAA